MPCFLLAASHSCSACELSRPRHCGALAPAAGVPAVLAPAPWEQLQHQALAAASAAEDSPGAAYSADSPGLAYSADSPGVASEDKAADSPSAAADSPAVACAAAETSAVASEAEASEAAEYSPVPASDEYRPVAASEEYSPPGLACRSEAASAASASAFLPARAQAA